MKLFLRLIILTVYSLAADVVRAETPQLPEPVVQALQRTLNERLEPSPALQIDGKLETATIEALKEFQRSQKLEPTGEAGPETFRALGPLWFTDQAIPVPEKVNAEKLSTEPVEMLGGPPLVTCKAWAIADAQTGELLWSERSDAKLPMASTTKMMTAHLVCRLAAADPQVLEEVVTISAASDKTSGSTADVREGEQLSVGELLYGLMLPSGNDAGVALAEHFGSRAGGNEVASAGDEKPTPLAQFVAAMNDQAKELGMAETHYVDPHGLSPAQHVSSARDLVKLAFAARQNPLFRQYVSTRQRGVTVTGSGGYLRSIVWKNSNQLLGREGYVGIKTGTTGAAGACLVSCGSYEGDELIVVVLGSTSPDARYVDSRNLFRWAWRERRDMK